MPISLYFVLYVLTNVSVYLIKLHTNQNYLELLIYLLKGHWQVLQGTLHQNCSTFIIGPLTLHVIY